MMALAGRSCERQIWFDSVRLDLVGQTKRNASHSHTNTNRRNRSRHIKTKIDSDKIAELRSCDNASSSSSMESKLDLCFRNIFLRI